MNRVPFCEVMGQDEAPTTNKYKKSFGSFSLRSARSRGDTQQIHASSRKFVPCRPVTSRAGRLPPSSVPSHLVVSSKNGTGFRTVQIYCHPCPIFLSRGPDLARTIIQITQNNTIRLTIVLRFLGRSAYITICW